MIHFGDSDFEDKFLTVLKDVGRWRAEVGTVESVDLRFDGEAVVNQDPTLVAKVGRATGGERRAATGCGREFEAGDDIAPSRACGFALDFTQQLRTLRRTRIRVRRGANVEEPEENSAEAFERDGATVGTERGSGTIKERRI